MQIGDLVKYRETTGSNHWEEWIGIVIREYAGTDATKLVHWLNNGERGSFAIHELEAV